MIKTVRNPNPTQLDMQRAGYFRDKKKVVCYLNIEQWLPILDPSLKPWYYVSNFGRVYSKLTNSIIRQRLIGHGYSIVTLMGIKSPIDCLVHRLVLQAFNPTNDPSLQVNHIDGNKLNNFYGEDPTGLSQNNLEWVTSHENNMHAVANNLRKIGEEASFSVLTNAQVHEICRCLELAIPVKEICDRLNLDHSKKYLIYQIKYRNNWTHISKDYKF